MAFMITTYLLLFNTLWTQLRIQTTFATIKKTICQKHVKNETLYLVHNL